MTWSVVCDALAIVFLEYKFCLARVHKFVNELGCQCYAVPYIGIVYFKDVRIFVTHCEGTCRTCSEYRFSPSHCLADASEVEFRLFYSLILESVRDQGHTAAFLLLKKIYAISESIHDLHEVLCKLRIVVVCIAAMEIADLLCVCFLLLESMSLEPCFESLSCIFRECPVVIDSKDTIHNGLHRLQSESKVHYRSHCGGQRSEHVSVCQHKVTKFRFLAAILQTGVLDKVTDLHI